MRLARVTGTLLVAVCGELPVANPVSASCPVQNVTIVGGSLSGLTLALACAHRGIAARVLEQARDPRRRGGSLGVDRGVLMKAIRGDAQLYDEYAPFPLVAGRRRAVAWQALYGWLRAAARQHPAITLEEGVLVEEIYQGKDEVIAVTADGRRYQSRLMVGADGYQSLIRRVINPGEGEAAYAGYLLWRGLVDEAELPLGRLPRAHEEVVLVNEAGHRLVAYAVAGRKGSLAAGERWLSFTWYDAGCAGLLRELGCISASNRVLRTLVEEDVPGTQSRGLCSLASRIWPEPWRSIVTHALERRQVFATPVAELLPLRLARGRLAIIGDAAHIVSPAMGKGFLSGIGDAATLAECLVQCAGSSSQAISAALASYADRRLPEAQSLVTDSRKWSRAFAARWTSAVSRLGRGVEAQDSEK